MMGPATAAVPPRGVGEVRRTVPAGRRVVGAVVLAVYVLVVAWNLLRREPNFDELQAWGIARASRTPLDLVYHTAYEGRFPLWHLVLWLVQRVSVDILALRVTSLVLAIVLALQVLSLPKVSGRLRLLLLGTFPLLVGLVTYSRDYALTAILALGVVGFEHARRHLGTAVCLALLALVNLFGLMTALVLTAAVGLQWCRTSLHSPRTLARVIGRLLIVLAAGLASASRITPPEDSSLWRGEWSSFRVGDTLATILDGWSAVLAPIGIPALGRIAGLAILTWLTVSVGRRSLPLGTAVLVLVTAATANFVWGYFAGWWHAQQIWIGIVALVLLARSRSGSAPRRAALLGTLALLQVVPHLTAVGDESWSRLRTSNSLVAARDLRSRCGADCTVVADTDLPTATVLAAHLDRAVVAVNRGNAVRYASYDSEVRVAIGWLGMVDALRANEPAIGVVSNGQPEFFTIDPPEGLEIVARFDGPTASGDAYLVVRLAE